MEQRIYYFDHAATTYVKPQVRDAMLPFLGENYGNPSGVYTVARAAKTALDEARDALMVALNAARASEIYFTGSGTESDNWALKGVALGNMNKGKHLITSAIEHHAVLHTMQWLEKQGFEVTVLPVDGEGFVSVESVRNALRDDTTLVSIMFANNEIGTIQPIADIGALCRERGVIFHTDAVQAFGSVPIDVQAMNIDLLSLSAHKLYGPKGVGALYIRNGTRCESIIHGGAQERGRRASTENMAGIAGLAAATNIAHEGMAQESARLSGLRDSLIDGLMAAIPYSRLNGPREQRLPNNVNLCFEFIEGESLLLLLDRAGIQASSGSACTSGSLDPSHVLLAIGLPHEIAHGSLRLTVGACTTQQDIDHVLATLPKIVQRLRDMSPLYERREEETHV